MSLPNRFKIGFDVRLINSSGIGTVIRSFLKHLDKNQMKDLVLFGHKKDISEELNNVINIDYGIYSLSQHLMYSRFLEAQNLPLFHMPHFDVPFLYKKPIIITVHDLIHLVLPQYSRKVFAKQYAQIMFAHATKVAKSILVVSYNTRRDLIHYYPDCQDKIVVTHPGVDEVYKRASHDEIERVRKKYKLPDRFFLYVGNLRGSKNIETLIKAYLEFKKSEKNPPGLVLAGKNFLSEKSVEISPEIQMLGLVPGEDLPALYSASFAFIFPSLYEGFGLPPLEAMACGTPVLSSFRASLPEVCDEAAIYFDPLSISSMVRSMKTIVNSPEKYAEMRQMGIKQAQKFTWSKFVEQTWKVYEDVYRACYIKK